MRENEIGSTRVWTKGSGNAFAFHPDCYEAIKNAWVAGESFFSARDLYGDEFVIRLGDVNAISLWTPSAIAEAADDRKRDDIIGDIE